MRVLPIAPFVSLTKIVERNLLQIWKRSSCHRIHRAVFTNAINRKFSERNYCLLCRFPPPFAYSRTHDINMGEEAADMFKVSSPIDATTLFERDFKCSGRLDAAATAPSNLGFFERGILHFFLPTPPPLLHLLMNEE